MLEWLTHAHSEAYPIGVVLVVALIGLMASMISADVDNGKGMAVGFAILFLAFVGAFVVGVRTGRVCPDTGSLVHLVGLVLFGTVLAVVWIAAVGFTVYLGVGASMGLSSLRNLWR